MEIDTQPSSSGKLRIMKCNLGCLSRADGSCSFSSGKTSVWASVNGPGDIRVSSRLPDKMSLDVSFRPKSGDAHHNNINFLLEAALDSTVERELFPRTSLCVTCHALQSDGSISSATLTAAGLAVLDSAVPTNSPFCGIQVSRVDQQLVVDPDQKTENKADAHFVFACKMLCDGGAEIITSESSGMFTISDFENARLLAIEAAKDVFRFYKEVLQRKLSIDVFNRHS